MSGQPFQLDPEVEHVLQEVARDPNSALLRVERPTVLRGLLETEPRVGVATAGLTTAERHLVQTRRAETALALRFLLLHALHKDPRGTNLLSRQGVIDTTFISRQLSVFESLWKHDSSTAEAADVDAPLVERYVRHDRTQPIPFLQVCAASLRLEPSDSARSYAAQWLLLEHQERSALNIMMRVFENTVTTFRTAVIGSNMGLGHHRIGCLEDSLRWYARASDCMPTHVASVVGRLVVAAQLGHRAEFLRASRILEESHTPNSPDIDWERQAEGARKVDFQRGLRPQGRDMLRDLSEKIGPTTRSFVDVLR